MPFPAKVVMISSLAPETTESAPGDTLRTTLLHGSAIYRFPVLSKDKPAGQLN